MINQMIFYEVYLKSENNEWIPVYGNPEDVTPINFLTHGFRVVAEKSDTEFVRIRNVNRNRIFKTAKNDENWVKNENMDWDTVTGVRYLNTQVSPDKTYVT